MCHRHKNDMVQMVCIECGAHFQRSIGPRTYEVKCPKCGGVDVEVDGGLAQFSGKRV